MTNSTPAPETAGTPRTITLSSGHVWELVTFAPLAGDSKPELRWVHRTARGPGSPLMMPIPLGGALAFTADDHRAIADVLAPRVAWSDSPTVRAARNLIASQMGHEHLADHHDLLDELCNLVAACAAGERTPALDIETMAEAYFDCTRHWDDGDYRSANRIHELMSYIAAALPAEGGPTHRQILEALVDVPFLSPATFAKLAALFASTAPAPGSTEPPLPPEDRRNG